MDKNVVRFDGVIEDGKVRFLGEAHLAEGTRVSVEYSPDWQPWGRPFENEPLTEEDVRHDIEMGKSGRW